MCVLSIIIFKYLLSLEDLIYYMSECRQYRVPYNFTITTDQLLRFTISAKMFSMIY